MTAEIKPHKVIVKTMSVQAEQGKVYEFFRDVKKRMEAGQAARSIKKEADGSWTFDHANAGKAKMCQTAISGAGVIDHVFYGGGLQWKVFVRIIPNNGGSTTTWTFIRPDGLTDEQFETQLLSFDREIELWSQALESH